MDGSSRFKVAVIARCAQAQPSKGMCALDPSVEDQLGQETNQRKFSSVCVASRFPHAASWHVTYFLASISRHTDFKWSSLDFQLVMTAVSNSHRNE
ncbi:hypothetical protein JOH50_006479 [Rhizobium leguminosarum]|uniref:hypothetical protein n=1 Tax=Rhizobium leguminosarum TaxID=384 RepID=UPI001AE6089D|nr:hypothetical protein [Rhizobium leguminosarum]MBP2490683.1 hypothetical protein [Rhizobium leguminosarum]